MAASALTPPPKLHSLRAMKSFVLRACACLFAIASPAACIAQDGVRFEDLAGWWAADPEHGGESSHIALQFIEQQGRREGRLWLMAIGAFDIPLGELTLCGNSVNFKEAFPLTWNRERGTLTGTIPAEAAPVYEIPIEFRRSAPVQKPQPRDWQAAAPRPRVRWSVDTGAGVWAGLERDAASGLLFVGNDAGDLHAIDRDGKLRWKFATGKPIRSQPRVIGRALYVASDSGYLYRLDRDTGAEAWRARVDTALAPRLPPNHEKTRWDRYGSSVVADDRRLYYASRDKKLYALDIATGREAWHVAATDIMTATPALHGGDVIFAAYDGKVQAVSAKDGRPHWSYDAKVGVPGDLVIADGRVLLGSRSYDLIALDAASGRELWKHYYWFSWIESPPVVRDGVVYTGSSDATNVYAINLADGSLRWQSAVPGYPWQRTAVNEDLVITGSVGRGAYPASRNGALFALERTTGAFRWIYVDLPSEQQVKDRVQWGFAASPVLGEGVVYAADLEGRVYALELS
jgi:outer membrane protein assembly factor BamB